MTTRAANLPVSPVSAGRHGFPDVYVRYMQRTRIFDTACRVVTDRGLLEASFDHIQQPTGVTKGRAMTSTRRATTWSSTRWHTPLPSPRCASARRSTVPRRRPRAWTRRSGRCSTSRPPRRSGRASRCWRRSRSGRMRGSGAIARWHRCAIASSASCPDRPKDAPQWGVEAVIAALRPQLVGDAVLKPTPRLHRDLVNLVRTMCGCRRRPPWPSAPRATRQEQAQDRHGRSRHRGLLRAGR